MRNNKLLLVILGILISLQAYTQIPAVLQESDFSTRTGVFKDSRDGKYYFYKKYGAKEWFMQNLNWDGGENTSWEGPADPDGKNYGRFYKMDKLPLLCPTGWRTPINEDWRDLTNDAATEYGLTEAGVGKANMMTGSTYDMRNFMMYMRGGDMVVNGGLWADATGAYSKEICDKTQFNFLPSGHFTGVGYEGGHGVGVRSYVLATLSGSNRDRYRNYELGTNVPSSTANNRSTLKHDRKTNNNYFGNVRCVRDAQTMKDQVIITEEIDAKVISDAPFALPAKATSGLAMTYVSSDPSVATVGADGTVTILKAGVTNITASQAGNSEYNPADNETLKLSVYSSKYYVTLPSVAGTTISPSGKQMVVGDTPFKFSIEVISGYEGTPVVTLSNGTTLVPTSISRQTYNYELSGLTADLTATIVGITKTAVVGFPKFATISDIQAGATDWEARTKKALEYLIAQTPKLDAIFITGDITNDGTVAQFNSVKTLVKSLVPADIAVHYSLGNDDWKDDPITASDRFVQTIDQDLNKFIVIKGYPFITLSAISKEKDNSYSIDSKEFLKRKLTYAKTEYPGKPIYVIQHIPNTGTVYGSGTNLWGSSNITSILEAYPEVISISGNSQFFIANELSIHQNKFTSINTGSIAPARMESGLDDGIQPPGSENLIEGTIISNDANNDVLVKRIDFQNSKAIKQDWKIEAPHDGSKFTYKGRTGGTAPYFDAGATVSIKDLKDITFKLEVPAAKDDDDVTQYLIEVLDDQQNPLMKPIYKFTSDYYLATSGTVATTISKDVSGLVENTDYYVRITAIDAFGKKSTSLLSDKITTKPRDTANPSDYDIIADRVRADEESQISTASLDASVDNSLSLYDDAVDVGSFTNINYKGQSADTWSSATGPSSHLDRLKNMALAYVRPDSKYYGDDDLYTKIVAAVDFYYKAKPYSTNWWHATVGSPRKMGVFLLEMRKGKKKLPVLTEGKFLDRMENEPWRQAEEPVNAGANRTDIAMHYLYRACLTGDDALLKRAFVNAYEPLKVVQSGEGVQVDDSYLLHGQQLQLASYGQEFMTATCGFGIYSYNTEYKLTDDQTAILSSYARKTFFKIHRGQYIHHNSLGRGISRTGSLSRGGNSRLAEALMLIDPANKTEYEVINKRLKAQELANYGIVPENKSYFVGDYVVHTRPEFSFAVRTISNRTVRSEWGNGEALQTYFLSDGSTSFMQKGDEYYNVPVGWNWTRLPGTTAPQYPFNEIPQWTNSMQTGTSNFTGGVSDGLYSANTYLFKDTWKDNVATNPEPKYPVNTEGRKSWFFFDDEIVCLGTGLTSTCEYPLNTTVEQNLLKSDVIVSTTSGEETIAQSTRGEKVYEDNLKWVLHNGAGYYFPKGGKVHTENVTTTRAWYDINKGYSQDPVSTDVFSLWFDHGLNPTDSSYAYVVVPNKKTAAEMNSYDTNNIEILSNTSNIQAVRNKKANILQIIFTKEGKFEYDGMTIETDEGAAIILKNIGTPEVVMHIADPGQNRVPITVKSLIPSVSNKKKETVCDFSGTGRYAGATKEFTINSESKDAKEPVVEKNPDFEYKSVVLADTYVADSDKNTNFGASDELQIKLNDVDGYHRQAYTKLSLNELDKYTNKQDYAAKVFVEFYVTSANTDIKTTNWVLTPVEDLTWDENLITWNNRPVVAANSIASVRGFVPKAGVELSDVINRVKFDITDYALAEYAKGNKIISLNINNDVAGPKVNATFASKEHADTKVHPIVAVRLYKKEEASIKSVTINGEELTDLSQTYTVPETNTQPTVEITVNVEGVNQLVGDNKIVVNVEKASVKDVVFTVKNGDKTKEYTLRVEKRFSFDEITKEKWGHLFIVNNNSANNGGYKFTSYKWIKNEGAIPVGTKQYYREKEATKSTLRVEMTTEGGDLLKTWTAEVTASPLKLMVYPNPVVSGKTVYLDAKNMPSEFFNDASLKISNINGMGLKNSKAVTEEITPIEMPTAPGVYVIKVTSEMYEETFKVIVK